MDNEEDRGGLEDWKSHMPSSQQSFRVSRFSTLDLLQGRRGALSKDRMQKKFLEERACRGIGVRSEYVDGHERRMHLGRRRALQAQLIPFQPILQRLR